MSDILFQLSQGLTDAVATAGVGVVRIDARNRFPASGLVWSNEGLIVTAHHVVRRDENIQVGLPDGRSVDATLVGRDPARDVALLRIDATAIKPAPLEDGIESGTVQTGQFVLALGRPGRTVQATFGIVSALGDSWHTSAGGLINRYLQTDVVMYPGFSGGPLIDVAGRVLGMNSSALMRGVSIAVPVTTLRQVVEELEVHGRVRRGYLGVSIQPVQLPPTASGQLDQTAGLIVMAVHPGGPAEQANLMVGDILTRLGDRPIQRLDDLVAALSAYPVGGTVSLQIVRGGDLLHPEIVLGER